MNERKVVVITGGLQRVRQPHRRRGAHGLRRSARHGHGGLLVWVASTSTRGGHPPFVAPYFSAKAVMDALAESYAGSEVVATVADRIRTEFYHRIGIAELLPVRASA